MNAAAEEEVELRSLIILLSKSNLLLFSNIEIHDEMFHVEVEIFKVRSKLKQWMRYRDATRIEEQRAIQSLERELAYMIDNYVVLSSISTSLIFELKKSCCSSFLEYLEESTKEERLALTQRAHDKIEQKTRAATERVAMGLDRFTKKMLSENKYMNHEVCIGILHIDYDHLVFFLI
jgi:hypothetical protein